MKIMFTFGKGDYTGAAKNGHTFMQGARKLGHEIIALIAPYTTGEFTRTKDILDREGFHTIERDIFNSFINFKNVTKLKTLLVAEKIDLVVTLHQNDVKTSALASYSLDIPLVAVVQSKITFHGNWLSQRIKTFAYKKLINRSTHLICLSESTKIEHENRFEVTREKITIIPSIIDFKSVTNAAESTDKREKKKSLGFDDNDLIFVNTGRVSEQKGHRILIKALQCNELFKSKENAKMIIIGAPGQEDLSYAKEIEKQKHESGIADRIHFLGWREDIPEILGCCDFYIHSALWEGPPLPLAILEAMACKLGIVMTDCAGKAAGFIDGKHGWCVRHNNANELSEAITKVLTLSALERRTIGLAAYELAKDDFDSEVNSVRFVKQLESLF